eukprot:5885570-Pyramimonas_sp.AAC.1
MSNSNSTNFNNLPLNVQSLIFQQAGTEFLEYRSLYESTPVMRLANPAVLAEDYDKGMRNWPFSSDMYVYSTEHPSYPTKWMAALPRTRPRDMSLFRNMVPAMAEFQKMEALFRHYRTTALPQTRLDLQ